jgi:hypothetical protein
LTVRLVLPDLPGFRDDDERVAAPCLDGDFDGHALAAGDQARTDIRRQELIVLAPPVQAEPSSLQRPALRSTARTDARRRGLGGPRRGS